MSKKEQEKATPSVRMVGQYARDISFECPRPAFLSEGKKQEMSMEVGVEARKLKEDNHEVILKLRCTGQDGEKDPMFIAEVEYAGVFEIKNLPPENLSNFMAVDGAAMVFPFARQVLMQSIGEGGFRPPLIEPINFHGLYMQAQQRAQQKAEGTA